MRINNNMGSQYNNLNADNTIQNLSSRFKDNAASDQTASTNIGQRITIEATKMQTSTSDIAETNSGQTSSRQRITIPATFMQTSASNISGISNEKTSYETSVNNAQVSTNTKNLVSNSEVYKQTGIGVAQLKTADSGLKEIGNYVERMKEIANSSASNSITDKDRTSLNSEFNDLKKEINKIGKVFGAVDSENKNNVSFNLFNDGTQYASVKISFAGTTSGLGLDSTNISTKEDAKKAMESLNGAYKSITTNRKEIENGMKLIDTNIKDQLQQSSTVMLAQANAAPNTVLSLLR